MSKKSTPKNTAAKAAKTNPAPAAEPQVEAPVAVAETKIEPIQLLKTSNKGLCNRLIANLKAVDVIPAYSKTNGSFVLHVDQNQWEAARAVLESMIAPKPKTDAELAADLKAGQEKAAQTVAEQKVEPAKETKMEKKSKKAAKPAKAEKPKDTELRVRLYAKGEFYFSRPVAERINNLPHIALEIKGKTITMTPQKSAKDAVPVKMCHAAPVLRVAKLLADTGWNQKTQDLIAKPVGEQAFRVEIK